MMLKHYRIRDVIFGPVVNELACGLGSERNGEAIPGKLGVQRKMFEFTVLPTPATHVRKVRFEAEEKLCTYMYVHSVQQYLVAK